MMTWKLREHDHIITAYAESADGPGWANSPIWVIIYNGADGKFRREVLQSNEQTRDMGILYNISEATHLMMKAAVEKKMKGKK